MKKVFKEKKIKIIGLILFLFSFSTFSQSNFEIKTIDEKKYIVHIAEKGQTLYAISKKYFVDSKFIIEANPKAKEGISEGQEVLIPYDIYLLNQEQFNADTTGFIVHKVLKSETQYGLIKKYSVTESDLKTLNPFLKLGLKEGQLLRIKKRAPILDLVQNSSDFNPKDDSSFVWYTAIERDSLVHVARKFKTTVSRIQRLNSWSYLEFMKSKVLKPGQKIKIFPKNFSEEASNLYKQNEEKIGNSIRINDTLVNSLRPKKKSYKVGLFLPLKTSEEGFYSLEYMIQNKKNFPNTSTMLADFYLGYKTALDSFSSSDFQVKTIVFDANENDSTKVTEIINSENFTSLDLIYGPWFSTTFNIVAKAAKENNIPCISTTLQSNKILAENNTTFKMLPSKNYMSEAIIEYIIDNNQRSGANVVNSEKAKDQGAVHSFKEYFTEYLKAKKGIEDTISEISGAKGGGSVTVLLSEDPAFVTSYFTQLGRSVHSGKSGFMLFGNYNLMNLENLDHGYYGRFNFHCVNPFFIDKQDEQVKKMWLKYRKIVYSDPSDIFFQAFDISAYFLGMMKRHGPDFFTLLPDFSYKGLVSDYNYFSPNFNTGFENRAVKFIEVKENRLSLVKKDKKTIKKTGNK